MKNQYGWFLVYGLPQIYALDHESFMHNVSSTRYTISYLIGNKRFYNRSYKGKCNKKFYEIVIILSNCRNAYRKNISMLTFPLTRLNCLSEVLSHKVSNFSHKR